MIDFIKKWKEVLIIWVAIFIYLITATSIYHARPFERGVLTIYYEWQENQPQW